MKNISSKITNKNLENFKNTVWNHYKKTKKEGKRDFPWRNTKNPYHILVSEIMLQQTQAERVVSKYISFLKKWPTLKKLAQAELREVLAEWSGLGYNRRGKSLWLLAKIVQKEFAGEIPQTPEELVKLPGIGPYTARAILAFAYNKPYVCIETNIRSVFIYSFFSDNNFRKIKNITHRKIDTKIKTVRKIADSELFPLIEQTLDKKNPREWYYALMDYGSYLKKIGTATNDRHKSYTKQSKFKGSLREARGAILRNLIQSQSTLRELQEKLKNKENLNIPSERLSQALTAMQKEGIIIKQGRQFTIGR